MLRIIGNKEFVKVRDLKKAIRHIEKDDKLHLDAEVEIYHEGGKICYGIIEISHFHICPNLVLKIKKMGKK